MDLEEVRGVNTLPEADNGVIFYVNGSKVSPSTKRFYMSFCVARTCIVDI